ncbi:sialate O-acetylesterase [Flavobacterium sp. W21_SRS_FM6]|uniref:sialate O-acetylesterase n=1 Tax=Flavobacterium sp. W21_SRS_FM6 TaxID=3240268 RepID=UPI003F911A13
MNKISLWANIIFIGLLCSCTADNKPKHDVSSIEKHESTMPQKLKMATIFTDHMVLQRHKTIVIWGQVSAGENLTVSLLKEQQVIVSQQTQAAHSGQWQVSLPAQPAGGPFTISVSQGDNTQLIKDVLIGDIWLASGQSNMEWNLAGNTTNWQQEVADSDFPNIRFLKVEKKYSATAQNDVASSGWKIASPATSGDFSAVAWHFAKRYHQHSGIPVAIIDSTWGGTPAEAWTSINALQTINGYQTDASDMLQNAQQWQQEFKHNDQLEQQKWQLVDSLLAYADGKILQIDFDDSQWSKTTLPTTANSPLSHIVWARKHFQLSTQPQSVKLDIGELNQIGRVFINGQQVYTESWQDTTKEQEIPAELLHPGDNIIVIRAVNSWDNKVLIGKKEDFYLQLDENKLDLSGQWLVSNEVEPKMPDVKFYNWKPGVLFNAMIHPLINYPIAGVIWYQGENNVGTNALYSELFKGLINDWRAQWQQPELPFLFVQLASYLQAKDQPVNSDWALLREAQTSALTLPNTGMAVTIDIGNADDIHPRNKADVGERLWRAAQHIVLQEDVSYSGPSIEKVEAKNLAGKNVLVLSYQHIDGGLTVAGDKLLGFAIAGSDGKFVNADAKIEGDTVIVSASKVKQPVSVRYAWADNSPANLYNAAHLPAIPFRLTLAN